MAQFFSAFQPDYGADITARGYTNAANTISGAIMHNAGKKQEEETYAKRMQMQATIQEQMQQSALARQAAADIAGVGGQPVIDEASGKVNVHATLALTEKLKRARSVIEGDEDLKRNLGIKQQAEYADSAARLGVKAPLNRPDPSAVQAAWNSGQDISSLPRTIKPSVELPQLIQMAEDEKKLEMQKKLAAAVPPSASRYNDRGAFAVNGQYIGNAVRDGQTGAIGFFENGESGEFKPIPQGAQPMTATALQKSVPSQSDFRKIRGELTDAEISLRNMDRFMTSREAAGQGMDVLANRFSAGMKTLLDQGLNTEELATRMANGQLQGLLGANRTNVVGGGVMTEQDALRIIQRLGGNVDAFSNIETVKQAIGEVYSDRYKQYEDNLRFHNAAVDEYYGTKGFPKAEKAPFSSNFNNDYQAQQAQQAAPVAASPNEVQPVAPIDDILKKYLQ